MATFRTQNTGAQGFGTSLAIALTGVQSGDLIVVGVRDRDGETSFTVSDNVNAGNYTAGPALGVGDNGASTYYKLNSASGNPTVTISTSVGNQVYSANVSVYAPSGSFTLDQTNTANNASGTSHSHGSITTTGGGVIVTVSAQGAEVIETANADFTALTSPSQNRSFHQYRLTSGAVTTTGTYTTDVATTSKGAIISFTESGGAATKAMPVFHRTTRFFHRSF